VNLDPVGDSGMTRGPILAVLAALTFAGASPAQAPQFRWRTGQALTYKVSQLTVAEETIDAKTQVTTTQLDLVKRWQVTAVDANGVATVQMTLASLRMETKQPSGDKLLFDSAKPAESTEALRDDMSKYIGPPLTVVRLDARGQLVEVKESKFGPESRLESDLPFKIVLPADALSVGKTWDRNYAIKLEPPHGTGESFEATQKYTLKGAAAGIATIGLKTTVKNPPEAAADQLPLLPLLPEGDIQFDFANGRLKGVKYQIRKELPEHRGEGSKYLFKTTYSEELIGAQ
jgi:hypothetical protein